MRPFRAPREARKISKGTSVTCQANVATQEATPDLLQASSQEETALETVRKTLKGKTVVIKETQHPEEERDSLGDDGDKGEECVREFLITAESTQAQGTHSVVSSPNLSEFEVFLEAMETNKTKLPNKRPANVSNDEWWNLVLETEKRRVAEMDYTRQVDVSDILLGDASSDDDIPIASTLPALASKTKQKKKSKVLWTYEAVAEATGVSSKYWDAEAPHERATKKQAKEKLSAITVTETQSAGLRYVSPF